MFYMQYTYQFNANVITKVHYVNSEKCAHIRSNLCYLICLRHLIRPRTVTVCYRKTFFFMHSQDVQSFHKYQGIPNSYYFSFRRESDVGKVLCLRNIILPMTAVAMNSFRCASCIVLFSEQFHHFGNLRNVDNSRKMLSSIKVL